MGRDMFFRSDIARALAGLAAAGADRGPEFHAALWAVARAFGLDVTLPRRDDLVSDLEDLAPRRAPGRFLTGSR